MFNAANKCIAAALVAAAALAATGCGGDKNRERAEALVAQARECVAQGRPAEAVALLDTLDKACRDQVEIRKQGMPVRWQAMESITTDSISATAEKMARFTLDAERLEPLFREVSNPGTAGFKVAKSLYKGNEMSRTTVQPRIDDTGYFFFIINNNGKSIGLQGLTVGGVSATNSRAISMDGSELQTLRQEEAAPVAEYIVAHRGEPLTIELTGSKGTANVKLTADETAAFADTWTYAIATQQLRAALINREKLERRLHQIRDNLANLD